MSSTSPLERLSFPRLPDVLYVRYVRSLVLWRKSHGVVALIPSLLGGRRNLKYLGVSGLGVFARNVGVGERRFRLVVS